MPFANYIQAAQETWESFVGDRPPSTLVITTESRTIRDEATSFQTNTSSTVTFLLNEQDVTQDTGYLEDLRATNSSDNADEILLSALSSLQLQLSTRITLGNCCSNFHLLLKDLLEEGCGMPNHKFQCLQQHANPNYRLCCSWDKTPECLARRNGDGHIQSELSV